MIVEEHFYCEYGIMVMNLPVSSVICFTHALPSQMSLIFTFRSVALRSIPLGESDRSDSLDASESGTFRTDEMLLAPTDFSAIRLSGHPVMAVSSGNPSESCRAARQAVAKDHLLQSEWYRSTSGSCWLCERQSDRLWDVDRRT